MTAKRLFPRAIIASTFAAAMLLAPGAAQAQQAPSLSDLASVGDLADALPSPLSSPAGTMIDDVLGTTPDPTKPSGVTPDPGTVTDTLTSLLPPGGSDANPGGDPTGGTGGGSKSRVVQPASGSSGLVPGTTLSNGSRVDPRSIANEAARRAEGQAPFDLRGVGGRALHLAAPMAAPIGIAIAGVLGLVMLAKSNGRLDGLEDERKALGGWTVIRL